MKTFLEWSNKNLKTITITCRDQDNELENMLNHIKKTGNCGHSFSILVDPDDKEAKKFHWDGDGNDYIQEIKVS